jgi:oligosaccharyltransferase complex subunit delta (ribophorin II)
VHQAFIRCLSYINYEAVTFIAEAKDGKYSAQFDISDHFEHGGLHHIQIIVGDALIFPGKLEHHVGFLTVNGIPEPEKGVFQTKYLKRYAEPKPIMHTFKEPEPRPPMMISLIFTGACAIPLFGLLVAWSRLGVNVNKMESSFMLFHGAIASVFGLYFMYWLKLNMFDTLKYLAVLGSATFILGNRVLSKLATKEK